MTKEIAHAEMRDLNDVGRRITWCRKQLGLSIRAVSSATGINPSSYFNREHGMRTPYHEEYMLLADFFNSKWKAKFGQSFPVYEQLEITAVKAVWIMYGVMNE